MANDAVEDQQAEHSDGPRLSDTGLIGALARLLIEHQAEVIQPRVDAPKAELIKVYIEGGQSDLVVRVGDDVIGRYKVNTARPKVVVDQDNEEALNKYADKHGGTKVTIERDPTWEKALLKFAKYDEDTGLIIDTRSGEVVPGLKYEKGGGPTGGLTWTWEQGEVGKKRLMRLHQEGKLNHLLKETPELMAGPRPTAEDVQH
ncbi:hypothetical protein [Streptomyces sp. MBT33]|uniref:hypothetical protein n=1 Tax=Streptomyces sp. MBT33 TaxID=1488363 RepID=UPI00190D8259|nr:hypothetical protein [Streptomyces sp. MBT33]MBK3644475.1 hypothetical protein [Streptomyces sp. MBT33]